jgi:glycerol-3-phosphate acyltransferase PlsY
VQIAVYGGVIAAAYFLGSIPTGYLTGKARGIDIRQTGSGNIGATNTFRVLGKAAGIFVLLADACKGFLAARFLPSLALAWFPEWHDTINTSDNLRAEVSDTFGFLPVERGRINVEFLALAAGAAAVLGHNYTCWLRFKGGKGIATSLGVVLALVPAAGLVVLLTWGAVLLATRYVSIASITAAAALPFAAWLTHGSRVMVSVMTGFGLLAILKHRANIRRLLAGTENRMGGGKKKCDGAASGDSLDSPVPIRDSAQGNAADAGGSK